MKPGDWNAIEDLFHRLAGADPDERERLLSAQPSEVRITVEELLDQAPCDGRIEATVRHAAAAFHLEPASMAGPYRLVRELGHGGMGAVYLAIRADDAFEKQVAIKFVHRGVDSPLLRRRFDDERHILARLEHPYIARLLDAGATPDGRPWLAMEYVDGENIAAWIRSHNPALHERVELMIKVADAVEYANRNLIVHRDLKPGNIVIGTDGNPKLLDFGIAKLLDLETPHEGTTLVRLATPEYASPEQLTGGVVTTASDVYGLGAILFEILTGDRPFHFDTVSAGEAERQVTAGLPDRPSQRNPQWRRRLSGDLDNIVLKAMRTKPEDRYASAREFAADLRRFLSGHPVQARDYTAAQRCGKFLRRHRTASIAAAVVAGALVASSVISARFAIRARVEQQAAEVARRIADQQRARAEERNLAAIAGQRLAEERLRAQEAELARVVEDFYTEIVALPGSTPARRQMLESSIGQLERMVKDAPSRVRVRDTLASAYFEMGKLQGAVTAASLGDVRGGLDYLKKSLDLYEALLREQPRNPHYLSSKMASQAEIGRFYDNLGDVRAADRYLNETTQSAAAYLASAKDAEARLRVVRLYVMRGLVRLNRRSGDRARVEADLRRAEALLPNVDASSSDLKLLHAGAEVASMRGQILMGRQDWKGALPALDHAYALRQRSLDLEPNDTSTMRLVMMSLSYIARARRVVDGPSSPETIRANEKAAELAESLYRADPANRTALYDLAMSQIRLAESRLAAADATGALEPAERSIRIFHQLRDQGTLNVVQQRNYMSSVLSLGDVHARLNHSEAANSLYREALALAEPMIARNPRDPFGLHIAALACIDLAAALQGDEALRYAARGVEFAERAPGVVAADLARVHGEAALVYDRAGQHDRAEQERNRVHALTTQR